tara:strand:+ start:260075 stop:260662 length:588 start_codon:yes stop_codon:yes gene_type:complete
MQRDRVNIIYKGLCEGPTRIDDEWIWYSNRSVGLIWVPEYGSMAEHNGKVVAGWRERVDFPEWGLRRVRAKLDSGAKTSAIDVAQYEMIDDEHVRFEIVYRDRPVRMTKWVEARCERVTNIKPSSGEPSERVICKTTIRIGDEEFEAEIGLVCRKGMLCRMLIGRTAMSGRYLVDSSRKYVITKKKQTPAAKDEL